MDTVFGVLQQISKDPRFYAEEPCPVALAAGFEFRKARFMFHHPAFRDAAKWVRLMYVVDENNRAVVLTDIYTHGQYPDSTPGDDKRPSEQRIRTALGQFGRSIAD